MLLAQILVSILRGAVSALTVESQKEDVRMNRSERLRASDVR